MSFIVIECHGGAEYATIVIDEDGRNLVFAEPENAILEANECQDGKVVEI